ncbi:MAG: efflux RND transporter periplasmic adaptor subunit, partial [Deltaproteobacteria bacterium]
AMYITTVFKAMLGWGLLALLLLSCNGSEKAEPQKVIRPVRYIQIFSTGGRQVRTFSGTAQAGVESKLSFKVNGTIQRLRVKVGDSVKSGQLIAELDPTDYQIKMQETEASLARAEAEARNATANFKRMRALYENKNVSRTDLDSARAAADSSQATVRSINKQLELARRQLGYTRLKAPTRCTVASVPVEVNENVTAGQAIVRVTCGSQIEVSTAIPEVFIADIQEGSPATVAFDSIPRASFPAVVTEVGVAATGLATTFPVIVKLKRTDPRIRPGMAASTTFEFGSTTERPRFVLPLHAIGEDRQGQFVFIVKPQGAKRGVVRRRTVKTGKLTAAGLEVIDGIKDGDLVVTAGVKRLQDDQEVKVLPTKGK